MDDCPQPPNWLLLLPFSAHRLCPVLRPWHWPWRELGRVTLQLLVPFRLKAKVLLWPPRSPASSTLSLWPPPLLFLPTSILFQQHWFLAIPTCIQPWGSCTHVCPDWNPSSSESLVPCSLTSFRSLLKHPFRLKPSPCRTPFIKF